jgi:accessory gene regulator protein AgrB
MQPANHSAFLFKGLLMFIVATAYTKPHFVLTQELVGRVKILIFERGVTLFHLALKLGKHLLTKGAQRVVLGN